MVRKCIGTLVILALFTSLFSPASMVFASAGNMNGKVLFDEDVELGNKVYDVKQTDNSNTIKTKVLSKKGTMEMIMDKSKDKYISLETDYLTDEQEKKQLDKINGASIKKSANIKKNATINKSNGVITQAAGTWYNGQWNDYTISFADKTTMAAIAGLIVSWIPYVGRVAAAAAAIIVAYGVDTGYFSSKRDYQILGPHKIMERQSIKTYYDASRILLLDVTTDVSRIRVGAF